MAINHYHNFFLNHILSYTLLKTVKKKSSVASIFFPHKPTLKAQVKLTLNALTKSYLFCYISFSPLISRFGVLLWKPFKGVVWLRN